MTNLCPDRIIAQPVIRNVELWSSNFKVMTLLHMVRQWLMVFLPKFYIKTDSLYG